MSLEPVDIMRSLVSALSSTIPTNRITSTFDTYLLFTVELLSTDGVNNTLY